MMRLSIICATSECAGSRQRRSPNRFRSHDQQLPVSFLVTFRRPSRAAHTPKGRKSILRFAIARKVVFSSPTTDVRRRRPTDTRQRLGRRNRSVTKSEVPPIHMFARADACAHENTVGGTTLKADPRDGQKRVCPPD